MKRAVPVLLYAGGSIFLVLILLSFFPLYRGVLMCLMVYLLADLYLWSAAGENILRRRQPAKFFLLTAYWLPQGLLVSLVLYAQFRSFLLWHTGLRTWLISLLFITLVSKFFPVLLLLLTDSVRMIDGGLRFIRNIRPAVVKGRSRRLMRTGWILGGISWAILFSGMLFWPYDFRVKEQVIPLQGLPAGLDGTRIVMVSDLHLGSWTSEKQLRRVTDTILSLNPDLIVIAGDVFNFSTHDGDGFRDILAGWKATHGTYCILGNHDYGDYVGWSSASRKQQNMEDLVSYYKSAGWILLRNESAQVVLGSDTLVIVGVENWGKAKRFQKRADLTRALNGIPSRLPKILLSHDPTYWESTVSVKYPGIPLTLSGHTHGGQFGITFRGIPMSPAGIHYDHWLGLYSRTNRDESRQYLYINAGLGTIGYSGRIGILPEIALIRLECGSKAR